jgi:hypothetical protein
MNVSDNSNESLLSDLDDQEVWRASVGLDLTSRTVLEAEVLMWRIVQQRIARQTRKSLNDSARTL